MKALGITLIALAAIQVVALFGGIIAYGLVGFEVHDPGVVLMGLILGAAFTGPTGAIIAGEAL